MSSRDGPLPKAVGRWTPLVAAALEILAIFLGGSLLAILISRTIGLASLRERLVAQLAEPEPPFLRLSWAVGADLLLRYAILFALAYAVGRWHRRRTLATYGVTRAGRAAGFHLKVGVLLFAVGVFVPKLLIFLRDFIDLGAAPERWETLIQHHGSLPFWIYMAVGSYGLVPILEELFFRGYVQTRVTEDFGPAIGILITALAFSVSHTHFFIASVFSLGMLGGLFFSALLLSYARYRTGSVIPGIIAHALGNVPVVDTSLLMTLLLMLVLMIWYRRSLSEWGAQLGRTLVTIESPGALLVGTATVMAVLAIVLARPDTLPLVTLAAGLVALALEAREKSVRKCE